MPRILIIDDDESLRKMLRFRLRDSYEILHTASPEEGLMLALQHKPEAILVDLMMPQHTGFEVCQTLTGLSFTQLTPVFVISGAPKALYKDFCYALGAKGYFEKPIDFDLLQTQLAATVSKPSQDHRIEPRIRLRIGVNLHGKDEEGRAFEIVTSTEDVSRRGFACSLNASVKQNAIVEVFLWTRTSRRFVGQAQLVWHTWPAMASMPSCGFRFIEEPREWIF
jgi:two-component system cell cycle response regulator DivK